jgi:hypothetical protein
LYVTILSEQVKNLLPFDADKQKTFALENIITFGKVFAKQKARKIFNFAKNIPKILDSGN